MPCIGFVRNIDGTLRFLPAIAAAGTDIVTTVIVLLNQPDYPFRFLLFQAAMFGLALLLATRYRPLWVLAFGLLMAGVFLASASVGGLYIPAVAVAGWVMVKRLEPRATASFLDTEPQKGVIYTESELEAMRNRRSVG